MYHGFLVNGVRQTPQIEHRVIARPEAIPAPHESAVIKRRLKIVEILSNWTKLNRIIIHLNIQRTVVKLCLSNNST